MESTDQMLYVLWAFNRQATQKLLEALAELPAGALEDTPSPSRGSIWRLACHVYFTEEHFVRRCRGENYQRQLPSGLAELGLRWLALQEEALSHLATVSPADLEETLAVELGGRQFHFKRWELLLQAVTHSIQHRGELSILLTELGHPLPNMDLIVHLAESHGIDWPWK